jgi:hypothetical protein
LPTRKARTAVRSPEAKAPRTCTASIDCPLPCAAGAWHGRGLVCYARSSEGMGESGGRTAAYQSYGPGRAGKFSVLFVPKAGGTVTVYCGTFTGLATGKWNLVVSSDGPASGSFTSSTGTSGNLSGAVSGGNVSLTWGAGTSASGPISGTSAGGATALWNDGTGGSGSWSGSSTGC